MGAVPFLFLLAIGALPILSDQLPAYCGGVGASSYTPPAVTIPNVTLNRGTVITVTNATVVVNGDTSSVKALVANPGPDGISIQEAIVATNNNPGTWNIQFAPALKGATIVVDTPPSMGLSYFIRGQRHDQRGHRWRREARYHAHQPVGLGHYFYRFRGQHSLRAGSPELWELR